MLVAIAAEAIVKELSAVLLSELSLAEPSDHAASAENPHRQQQQVHRTTRCEWRLMRFKARLTHRRPSETTVQVARAAELFAAADHVPFVGSGLPPLVLRRFKCQCRWHVKARGG